MATTFTEKTHKQLLKKFHVLLAQANINNDGKQAILSSYNVESSRIPIVMYSSNGSR